MTATHEDLSDLERLPVATLYEAAGKRGDVSPDIRCLTPGFRLCGPAFTIKTMPGDNLGVFRALSLAPRGCVLVIDGGGSDRHTIWGGTSTRAAIAKGILGCLTNAAVRDIEEISRLGFPVFARGVSIRGTSKCHPGWLNENVAIGDASVSPGDMVVGDADGVLIIPKYRIHDVLVLARKKFQMEIARDSRVSSGEDIADVFKLEG